jgi:hypothetical protein
VAGFYAWLPAGSIVLWGTGYTVGFAGSLPWLADKTVLYWATWTRTASRS